MRHAWDSSSIIFYFYCTGKVIECGGSANALQRPFAPPERDDRPPHSPYLPPRNEASAKGPFSFFSPLSPAAAGLSVSPTHTTISSRGRATSAVMRARRLGSRTRTTTNCKPRCSDRRPRCERQSCAPYRSPGASKTQQSAPADAWRQTAQ